MSFLKKALGLVLGVVGAAIGFVVGGPAGAAIGFSVGMGIGSAAQLAAMKTKVPSTSSATGARLNISIDPDANRKIAFGETALGTDQRYWESWGPENSYFDQVIAAAGHEIQSFGKLFFDDEEVTFSGNNATGAYAGALTKADRTVGVTGTALTVGAGALWTSAASMTGVAHYALRIRWSQEKYPRGIPSRITRVGKGAKVYDPRRDSTQPGGSGAHRADDQSTWEYSPVDSNGIAIGRNPALQILWYEIGWRVTNPDTAEDILVCGRGRPLDDIDFASFITAANDCETEEYYSDVLLSTGDAHETNIAVLEAACAGKLMDNGGRIGLRIRNDTTGDIVQAFTDGDVLDTDACVWRPRLPLSERWNQGIGSFVDPRALYKVIPFPVVRDAAYEAEDGFKRPGPSFRFDAVQDGEQAQRLTRLELNISRYQGVFTAPFNWRAKKVRIWDCVTLTFPRLGFSAKIFRVLEKKTDPMGAIWLLLREDDPSIYDGGTVNPVPAPTAGAGYDARIVTAPDAGDWTVTPVYVDGGGARLPALEIVGSALAPNIVAVRIAYRQSAASDWISLGRFVTTPPVRTSVANIVPDTDYDIQLIYENAYGAFSTPTELGPFTSLAEFSAVTIVDQDWGATASEAAASNALVPVGVNLLTDTDFYAGIRYWNGAANGGPNGTGLPQTLTVNPAGRSSQLLRTLEKSITGTPTAGTSIGIAPTALIAATDPDANALRVVAGERIEFSVLVAGAGLSQIDFNLLQRRISAAGQEEDVPGVTASIGLQTVTTFAAGGIQVADFTVLRAFYTVPAGVNYLRPSVGALCSGAANPRLTIGRMYAGQVSAAQTVYSAYSPGFAGQRGSDITAHGVALAVEDQGTDATANSSYGPASSRPASVGNWSKYYNTTDSTYELDIPTLGWTVVADITGGLSASISPASAMGDRLGAGVITLSGFTVSASGGAGTLDYQYTPDAGITVGGTDTAPTFSYTVAVGEQFIGYVSLRIVDFGSGRTTTLQIGPLTFTEFTFVP